MTLVAEITERLNNELQAITAQLATLDADYNTKRAELTGQLSPIAALLKAAQGKIAPAPTKPAKTGKRFTMSAEGRANIRAALQARSARLAAEKGGSPEATTSDAPAATEGQSAPKGKGGR